MKLSRPNTEEPQFDRTFYGSIGIDQFEPRTDGKSGEKYHLAVRPYGIELKGETGMFHTWVTVNNRTDPPSARSGAGVVFEALLDVLGTRDDGEEFDIGEGELVGMCAKWERVDYDWGINKKTNEPMVSKGLLLAREVAPEEIVALIRGDLPTVATVSNDLDVEELDYLLPLINASKVTAAGLQKLVRNTPDFPKGLMQKVMGGKALRYLRERGYVSDGDGGLLIVNEHALAVA